jgi:protein-S-isoprenylcysteine O-methyltransferase Ste14
MSAVTGWTTKERLIAYGFVGAQFALFAAVFAPVRRPTRPAAGPGVPAGRPGAAPRGVPGTRSGAGALGVGAGAAVALAGAVRLGRQLTPVPLPGKRARLHTGGAYAHVRHPVYTGVMAASVARGLTAGSRSRLAASIALCGLLTAKARWEERHLRVRFPDYDGYASRTPRFLPRLRTPA